MEGLIQGVLTFELIDSPVLWVVGLLAVGLLVVVVVVRPRHPLLVLGVAIGAGLIGFLVATLLDVTRAFEAPLPQYARAWATVGFALAGAGIAGALARPWWRRVLAILLVVLALLTGALGVNRAFGVTHTLAAILGVQALDPAQLPPAATDTAGPGELWRTWTPPPDMPKKGTVGALSGSAAIPAPGYAPRDAALYLPPAALVAAPPPLPLIVFMMGQPGTPDPTSLAAALDDFASAHHGLAPIAIVADQLTSPLVDPACQDSAKYGAVSSYFNTAIPAWARKNLNIVDDPAYWVIGGYSNGAACAFTWGAQHPEIWGNILDVSGTKYPGLGREDATIATVFGGDRAAFEAAKPIAQLAQHPGAYDGHVAVFTWGQNDTTYGPGEREAAAAAAQAGFLVYSTAFPGLGHTGPVLSQGLASGIQALGPVLGLSPPSGEPTPSPSG